MELKINDKKEQPMLSRIEINGSLSFEGATPSTADVKKALSSELKVDEGLIAVKNIFTHFGAGKADFIAYSYLNKEDMSKIEKKTKKQKEAEAAAAKAAKEAPKEAPAAEKKEEPKPAEPKSEAKKEEKKAEEKPKEEKKEAPKEAEKKE